MLDDATGRTRESGSAPHPLRLNRGRRGGARRSIARPSRHRWPLTFAICVLPFTAQVKQRQRPPPTNQAFKLKVTFCVRGVISPLLSNIYLHVLDVLWTRHHAPLGMLVRYADDCAPRRRE